MRQSETIPWAGGEHAFRLAIGELRALEQRCNAGCFVVLGRLLASQAYVDDILSPIRLGLIGAGMPEEEARKTLNRTLEDVSLYGLTVTAADILRRFIMWEAEEDTPGELEPEVKKAPPRKRRSNTAKPAGQSI